MFDIDEPGVKVVFKEHLNKKGSLHDWMCLYKGYIAGFLIMGSIGHISEKMSPYQGVSYY